MGHHFLREGSGINVKTALSTLLKCNAEGWSLSFGAANVSLLPCYMPMFNCGLCLFFCFLMAGFCNFFTYVDVITMSERSEMVVFLWSHKNKNIDAGVL